MTAECERDCRGLRGLAQHVRPTNLALSFHFRPHFLEAWITAKDAEDEELRITLGRSSRLGYPRGLDYLFTACSASRGKSAISSRTPRPRMKRVETSIRLH